MVRCIFCWYFMQACGDWVLIIFGTQVIKKKKPVRPVFPDYLSVSYDYVTSDLNLNLLNYAKNIWTFEFLESVLLNNSTPQINLPTRVTGTSWTLINNILINSQENAYTCGNLTTSMSDHLPQVTIIENLLSDTWVKNDVRTLKRDFSKFHSDNFIRDLKSVNWSVATRNNPNKTSCLSLTIFLTNMPLLRNKPKERKN